MKIQTLTRAALLLLALTLGLGYPARAADDPTVGTPLEGVHRIVFTGDSMTEYGDGPSGYIGIIRSRLASVSNPKAFELLDAGKANDTSRDELARFDADVMAKKPDLVVINSGLNDAWFGFNGEHPHGGGWRGVPLDEFKRNVETMTALAQGGGARVMLLSTTICSENLNSPQNVLLMSYNQALRDIAHRHGCFFVDLQPPFRAAVSSYQASGGTDYTITVDGVNLSNRGNQMMADTVLKALLSPMPRGIKSRGK